MAELGRVRRRDMLNLSDRLGRLTEEGRGRWFGPAAGVLVGAGLGALVTGIPLLNSNENWDPWVIPLYLCATIVLFLFAGVCGLALRSVKAQRADSVASIKYDLDSWMAEYELAQEPVASGMTGHESRLRLAIRQVRAEAQQARRIFKEAQNEGLFWRLTGEVPTDKAWKKHRGLLAQECPSEVFETANKAFGHVAGLLTRRSVVMLSGKRTIRSDDKLDLEEAIAALDAADQALGSTERNAQ